MIEMVDEKQNRKKNIKAIFAKHFFMKTTIVTTTTTTTT